MLVEAPAKRWVRCHHYRLGSPVGGSTTWQQLRHKHQEADTLGSAVLTDHTAQPEHLV